jgi:DNA-binding MarR family transcriptional regulator
MDDVVRLDAPGEVPLTVSREALLVDGSDAPFRQLVHRLLAYASSLEAIRAGLGEMIGLSGAQYTILICVAHLQGTRGVGVKEIADHLSYTGAFVTIETGKLIGRGLVEKRQNPGDKRRVLLTVTGRARDLLNELAPAQRQINDTLFESLSGEEFSHLCGLAENLTRDARNAQGLVDFLADTKIAQQT